MMMLSDVKPGQTVQIEKLNQSSLRTRLMSMGMIKGTTIKVLRSAPLGDPMAVKVRSYVLSLRLDDAANIQVKEIS